jgi:hypothetical protein
MDFSLWNLLQETKNLQCADRRDRVYALLSIATEGHEDIKPEHDRSAQPIRLVYQVLRNKYGMNSRRKAKTLYDVRADCEFLKHVFGLSENAMLKYSRLAGQLRDGTTIGTKSRNVRVEFAQVDVQSSRVNISWSEWARCHGHVAVERLLENEL